MLRGRGFMELGGEGRITLAAQGMAVGLGKVQLSNGYH